MWAGFAIPFVIGSIRALHNYYDFVPDIVLVTSIPLFPQYHQPANRPELPDGGFRLSGQSRYRV